jgi:pimeloyl-ACP methyl ester carboxylesterase
MYSDSYEHSLSYFLEAIEAWRKKVDITNFVIAGHSLGGYIATSYAIQYSEHVKGVILLSPGGLTNIPENFEPRDHFKRFGGLATQLVA